MFVGNVSASQDSFLGQEQDLYPVFYTSECINTIAVIASNFYLFFYNNLDDCQWNFVCLCILSVALLTILTYYHTYVCSIYNKW